ncbi:hypothetical protein [Noviherbaspirillum pedocola]|uniref:Uncharacterized protein n=1 Tax=Noviherbaspirillum pedocola TaxID=2801341 RepID=A0A934W1T5_9BURK|nr:hypothetical protein [Noviherbaspirillum pedocola]MBK4735551.1 hypothetical protein [Noviherbaspirillum pedocola]
MALNQKLVQELVAEIEGADPIDWAMLNVDEQQATELIASSVMEHYETNIKPMTEEQRDYVIVSSLVKLSLENFVLNLRLLQAGGKAG